MVHHTISSSILFHPQLLKGEHQYVSSSHSQLASILNTMLLGHRKYA